MFMSNLKSSTNEHLQLPSYLRTMRIRAAVASSLLFYIRNIRNVDHKSSRVNIPRDAAPSAVSLYHLSQLLLDTHANTCVQAEALKGFNFATSRT